MYVYNFIIKFQNLRKKAKYAYPKHENYEKEFLRKKVVEFFEFFIIGIKIKISFY